MKAPFLRSSLNKMLAGSLMVAALAYGSLSYVASQPAFSHSPDMEKIAPPVQKGARNTRGAKSSKDSAVGVVEVVANAAAAPGEPESGVKLLMSILSRLGSSGTQVAFNNGDEKNIIAMNSIAGSKGGSLRFRDMNQSAADQGPTQSKPEPQSQFGQNAMQNSADPALSIRPQLNKRGSQDDAAANYATAAGAGGAAAGAQGLGSIAQNYPASVAGQPGATNAGIGSRVLSENPYIREFTPQKPAETDARSNLKMSARRQQINIIDEPLGKARADKADRGLDRGETTDKLAEKSNLVEHARDSSNSDSVTGIIRPSEQPGLFKYVREYLKESPKGMPAPAMQSAPAAAPMKASLQQAEGYTATLASNARAREESEPTSKQKAVRETRDLAGKDSNEGTNRFSFEANTWGNRGALRKAQASKKEELQRIAFLPPNAVHGINGLPLGATTSDTVNFLKARGKVSKVIISGFQIFTLSNARGEALLQAFVRDNHLEALRLFNPTFVPPQLDVNLGEALPSMKAKFGEPAFILEEPRSKNRSAGPIAKNYVYPISQVSFQLSRPNSSSAPCVLSMFLFRFL
ncbi:MAG: hypothetical protein JSS83_16840 [Cyanobacteria bacterium SZAS LIN-3]|nr:hypothetical protein [Cyanobacteria bacterium SZAS LIN-3]